MENSHSIIQKALVMNYRLFVGLLSMSLLFYGCQGNGLPNAPDKPEIIVTTYDPTDIGIYYATCGGDVVTSIQGLTLSEIGVCWSETKNPTIQDAFSMTDRVSECFVYTIEDLKPNTVYYVRAFALRGTQPYYGEEKQFQTLDYKGVDVVTKEVTDITSSSVSVSGSVISDGGVFVESRGFCWGTSPLPTISDDYQESGAGTGDFRSTIHDLAPETTYYIRSYAKNVYGVYYGQAISFLTNAAFGHISIDGNFDDWTALKSDVVVSAKNNPDSPWDAVTEIRCCSDIDFVYYYIKFNKEAVNDLMDIKDEMPIRLCIDTNNDFTTGYENYFLDPYEFIIEGGLADGGAWGTYDGTLYQRIAGSWSELLSSGNNLVTGKGGGSEYEIQLARKVFNNAVPSKHKFSDVFYTGIRFYGYGWRELSNMPNTSAKEGDGKGWGHLLKVNTVK